MFGPVDYTYQEIGHSPSESMEHPPERPDPKAAVDQMGEPAVDVDHDFGDDEGVISPGRCVIFFPLESSLETKVFSREDPLTFPPACQPNPHIHHFSGAAGRPLMYSASVVFPRCKSIFWAVSTTAASLAA